MEGSVDVIITIIGVESSKTNNDPESGAYPVSRMYRLEFESEEAAMGYLDTSKDIAGLLDVERLVGQVSDLSPKQGARTKQRKPTGYH